MKLFPIILARTAGLPFTILEPLSLQSQTEWDGLMEKYAALANDKKDLLELLDNSSNELHCGFVLKNLAYLKTNLLHGKKAKLSKKLESNLEEKEIPFYKKIESLLELYNQSNKELEELRNGFVNLYQKEITEHRLFLKKTAQNPVILNGLLMSSHSFLKQLEKYSQTDIATFAKKQFQTERTFLKYLSRICSKTSPFSTFSPISIFDCESERNLDIEPKSVFRLNNHLFALWRDALNNYPPFYRKMTVSLNPSLKKNEKIWVFLINTRNVESIQKMENNDLLEFIFEAIKEVGEEIVFEELTNKIQPTIETDLTSLEAFLLELFEYGFLEWRWPFSGLDPFWNLKLLELLENFKSDQFLQKIATSLKLVQENINLAETADFSKRKELQYETFNIVKKISESLLNESQLIEEEQVIDADQIKQFKANRFDFPPEKLFYEDVSMPFDSSFKVDEISLFIEELEGVLENLEVLHFNEMQLKLKLFFLANYKVGEAVSLLHFYESFYKNVPEIEKEAAKNAIETRLVWQREIINQCKLSKEGILTIQPELIKSLSDQVKRISSLEKRSSRGTFIQFFRENNLLKGFSDTTFEGNGKMMGRFLHLFPSDITKAVQNWIEKQRNGLIWVENIDASIYNPNLHPPLLPYEIRMPGSQNTLPLDKQVSVDDLAIVYEELGDELVLIYESTNRKIYIFDLGFEALESRSPLYQLLATFNFLSPSQSTLAEIVNDYFDRNAEGEIYFQPRIGIGKHLIIQRKRWFISTKMLPLKMNSESESGYFIRINQWIQSNKIPSKVFITVSPSELRNISREKGDDYKPQYIDFKSPVFVQLFHKLIKKVENKLKIEEFLPFPQEKIDNQKFATEFLVQWEI